MKGSAPPSADDRGAADGRWPVLGRPVRRRYSYGYVWLVTFTDLVALMLTFFVLLFAMSRVEYQKWQSLVRALTNEMNAVREVEETKPAIEFQVDEARPTPGPDLDYLTLVVRQQIAADPVLAGSLIRRRPDRLVMSLPGSLFYAPGSTALVPQAERAVFAIGGVLRNLSNAVAVEAYGAGPGRRASDWELALARAAVLTRMLAGAGYEGPILARGFAHAGGHRARPASSAGRSPASPGRIDIIIHEQAREGQ